jgi:hypothetical protein
MPSTKYPVYIEFSDTGHTAQIVHKNGTVVAILLCNGPPDDLVARQFDLAHKGRNPLPLELDVFPLEKFETIDLKTERLINKDTMEEIVG